MAVKCPVCRSADTQAGLSNNQCVNCGALFNDAGVVAPGVDDNTREMLARKLAPRQVNLVGALQDLQVAGAAAAYGDTTALGADVAARAEEHPQHAQALVAADAHAKVADVLDKAVTDINSANADIADATGAPSAPSGPPKAEK